MFTLHLTFPGVFILYFFIISYNFVAAPLFNVPLEVKQPDGSIINILASGDEYYHRLHDKNDYTIIVDEKTGYYVYAQLIQNELVSSKHVVGKVNPLNTNLVKGVNISPSKIKELVKMRQPAVSLSKSTFSTTGSLTNLVIFIRFKGEPEFNDDISRYERIFNSSTDSSLKSYYNEVSWGKLDIQSYFAQSSSNVISYEDIYPRSYYMKYDSVSNPGGYKDEDRYLKEDALIRRALTYVKTKIPANINLDENNDNRIDDISIVVSGDPSPWGDLLWPHSISFPFTTGPDIYINNKKVWNYKVYIQNVIFIANLCHEMCHTLGAPDLYPYDYKFMPVGPWELLGFNNGVHMSNYVKYKYLGWISEILEITNDGTYSIKPSTSQTNNVYKIKSPRHDYEYFVLEYRVKKGLFEKNLPGSGLLIYRVDQRIRGNASAPPCEIYLYRPDGDFISDGVISEAAFSKDSGRTAINDTTNPASIAGNDGPGGLDISNISALGDSMTFTVKIINKLPDNVDPYTAEVNDFNWTDISKTGTEITNWKNGTITDDSRSDDGYTPVPIPLGFSFNYFGQKYDSIYVGVNGLVSFTKKILNSAANVGEDQLGYFGLYIWPGNTLFPNSIAVAYFDFNLNKKDGFGGGRILYHSSRNKFVLSWEKVGSYFLTRGDTTNSFQLILNKDAGSIIINFKKFGIDTTRKSICTGIQGIPPQGISWVNVGYPKNKIPQDNSSIIFRPSAISDINYIATIPKYFTLYHNYPNPFNPATVISYYLPANTKVELAIFDILGRKIAILVDKEQSAGTYKINFDGKILSSGIYFYKLTAGDYVKTNKMVLLK